jgi:hypothetical protein
LIGGLSAIEWLLTIIAKVLIQSDLKTTLTSYSISYLRGNMPCPNQQFLQCNELKCPTVFLSASHVARNQSVTGAS